MTIRHGWIGEISRGRHACLNLNTGIAATSGTVMLAAMPVLLGGHLLIGAMNYDIASVATRCLHAMLP